MMGFLTAGVTSADAVGVFAQWQDANDMDSGFGFGVKHKFQIIPVIAIEARASWLHYDGSKGFATTDLFPLEAVGRAKLGLFYGGIGLGYYIATGDPLALKNSLGYSFLAGAEFTLFGLGAFAEGRYLLLEPDEKNIGGTRDMGGFGVNVGVVLPFF